jgi:hypothetical protein
VLACGALLAGIAFNGQINFVGNYLPQIYPTHLRGTGESFAISIGGRIVGGTTAFIAPWLANFTPGADPSQKLAVACASIAVVTCTLGWVMSRFMVEPDPARMS